MLFTGTLNKNTAATALNAIKQQLIMMNVCFFDIFISCLPGQLPGECTSRDGKRNDNPRVLQEELN
jgi:hypothetical protein